MYIFFLLLCFLAVFVLLILSRQMSSLSPIVLFYRMHAAGSPTTSIQSFSEYLRKISSSQYNYLLLSLFICPSLSGISSVFLLLTSTLFPISVHSHSLSSHVFPTLMQLILFLFRVQLFFSVFYTHFCHRFLLSLFLLNHFRDVLAPGSPLRFILLTSLF